jgi:aromatic-L-amino-acid decarboxylase
LDGIKSKFRAHIGFARYFADKLDKDPGFELLAPVPLNLVCFRYHPQHVAAEDLNELNALLEKQINVSGKAYITHTKIDGKYTLRACIGQTNVEQRHVDALFDLLKERAKLLKY